ncbi:MAG: hypothetical protein FWC51_02360 [Proteobacteria bacterium]|nr:hypothetical protein [Pseudomonadota bacterium]
MKKQILYCLIPMFMLMGCDNKNRPSTKTQEKAFPTMSMDYSIDPDIPMMRYDTVLVTGTETYAEHDPWYIIPKVVNFKRIEFTHRGGTVSTCVVQLTDNTPEHIRYTERNDTLVVWRKDMNNFVLIRNATRYNQMNNWIQ